MKTVDGNYVVCGFSGKICYTEREAGLVINGCKRHVYVGNRRWAKSAHGNSKSIPHIMIHLDFLILVRNFLQ